LDKEPLPDSDASFSHSKTRTVSHQQLMPESPADPKADNLAHDGGNDRGSDERPNIEAVGSGGEKSRRDQRRLGRQRNAHAFERDERRDNPDAVVGYELSHFVSPPTGAFPTPILRCLLPTRIGACDVEPTESGEFPAV